MAPSLKDTAKQGFNYNQMQHCPPRSSIMLCVRSPQIVMLPVEGDVCLFVREGQSKRRNVLTNVLILAAS